MITVPMFNSRNVIIGIIGIDNPQMNLELIQQLCAIARLVVDDIEKRQMNRDLEYLSYEDILTGLHNRNRYTERIQELQICPPQSLGVAYFDINGLKAANDLYGHSYGDRLIISAATVLKEVFARDIFRVGGDEFVVLCVDMDINVVAQIIRADEQMYAEKKNYYELAATGMILHREALEHELAEELRQGKYTVVLQPKVDMESLEVVGAEALIRKKGENGELMLPASFVPLYEKQQLIHYIDFFVLDRACQILSQWERKEKIGYIRIAVNVSYATFKEESAVDTLIGICREHDVSPSRIVLEITEKIVRIELKKLKEIGEKLASAGFRIVLDNYNSVLTNLPALNNIRFTGIKLDRSFASAIVDRRDVQVEAENVIKIVKKERGMIAEAVGIETSDQYITLKDSGCIVGQGYYFSKPLSPDEFEKRYS